MKNNEIIRRQVRRKAQKSGKSVSNQKGPQPKEKPIQKHRRITKKRSSIR